jgi:hypothetical protein
VETSINSTPSQPSLGKVYRIASLKRMGNNAIMYWLLDQYKGRTVYLNEVAPLSRPYLAYRCKPFQEQWDLEAFFYRNEDWPLNLLTSRFNDRLFDHPGVRYQSKADILILRDPFNHLASRFKAGFFKTKSSVYSCADLWLLLAREYVGRTNFCNNKILLNYNYWMSDIEYRKSISRMFDTEFNDNKLNEVAQEGGGSSFSGMEYQGNATEMETSNRWEHFLSDPAYMEIFKNREFYELSDSIFGNVNILDEETDETIRGNFCETAKKKTDLRIAMTNLLFHFVCKLKYHFKIGSIGQLKQLNLLPGTKTSTQK